MDKEEEEKKEKEEEKEEREEEVEGEDYLGWKKDKFIGNGSFGMVYLGSNREIDGLFCAIKELRNPHPGQQLNDLNLEIEFLSKFSHPNIVQYYGSNLTDDGVLSIYMEYASKGSIVKLLIDYGPFKECVIRFFTAQILSGLVYLHKRNIVHRDIKGANILVNAYGEVKVADFGQAKHISSFADTHSFRGTIWWMAPEIMRSRGYNLPVDIWSLACTVIEMATGKQPWHPYEAQKVFHDVVFKKSSEIPKIPDDLSEEGKDFLKQCLKHDPASRPTAAQLVDHPFVSKITSQPHLIADPPTGRSTTIFDSKGRPKLKYE